MGILFIDLGEVRTFEIAAGAMMTIGRDGKNDIVVGHPTVSRAHARIEADDGNYRITDFNSRNGTRVNGKAVEAAEELIDGARLRIGHVRAWFFTAMPPKLPRSISNRDKGVIFNCTCGQRLWSSSDTVGMSVVCGSCNKNVEVPDPALQKAQEENSSTVSGVMVAASDEDSRTICAVCQWPIERQEKAHVCEACHSHYHLDCWKENHGCATYGCAKVNALQPSVRPAAPAVTVDPTPTIAANGIPDFQPAATVSTMTAPVARPAAPVASPAVIVEEETPPAAPAQGFAWSYMLLALSVVGSLLGLLAFGAPAALFALIALIRLLISRADNKAVLAAAVLIGGLGAAAGVMISRFWWLGEPLF